MTFLAPTFVDEHEVSFGTLSDTGGSANTGSFSVTAGDLLVIMGSSEDSGRTLGTPTGGSLTYTLAQSSLVANNCAVYVWTAVCTSTTSITVTITVGGSGGIKAWGFNVLRFRNAAVGTSAKTNSTGAPTLNVTATRENSAICVINSDWGAVDGTTRTWRTNAGAFTEQHYFRDSARYTTYGGYHANAGTVSTDAVGLSAPTGQTYSIIAVEVKGTVYDLGNAALETDTGQAITVHATNTITVGQATEADSAQAIAVHATNVVAIGQASETDTANAITPPSGTTVSVGQATESDTAQAVSVVSTITVSLGQASETDTAQAVSPHATNTVAVGVATETDTAQAITAVPVNVVTVNRVSETDTANVVSVVATIAVTVGQASESDSAQAITAVPGAVATAVGQATESDTAFNVSPVSSITVTLGTATETDTANAVTPHATNTVAVGIAGETDTAQNTTPVVGAVSVPIDRATEADAAHVITPVGMGTSLIDTAEETDQARTITVASVITVGVGQATEADTASSVSVVLAPLIVGIGLAGETDTGQTITPAGSGIVAAIGTATETDTAQGVSVQSVTAVPVGVATETDTAQTVTVASAITVPINFASELDAGNPIALFLSALGIPVNGAVEASTAFAFTPLVSGTTILIGTAGESDTALSITPSFAQTVPLDRATETDTARDIAVVMASGRVPFSSGPCEDWEPLWCGPLSAAAMAVTGEAVTMATDVLWHLSGQRFGLCEVTLRPCRAECAAGVGTLDDWWAGVGASGYMGSGGPRPWWADGVWTNVCGGCTSGCSCAELHEALLPAPTRDVLEVRLDGVLLHPSAYRVDENRTLVRTDGGVWPYCQDMSKNDAQPGTWSVTITVGEPVPTIARRAMADLAAEFAKDCAGEDCTVPYDVTSLSRQGITLDFGNPNVENIDALVRLLGLRMVRLFLAAYNPYKLQRRGKVYDVNAMPNPWKRVDTS